MTNPAKSSIALVLDRSGSMADRKEGTITGINTFLNGQAESTLDVRLTLVQFDHQYESLYINTPVREIPRRDHLNYVPRGNTALLDAIGRTIVDLGDRLTLLPEHERPGKVLVVIVTDGEENASRQFSGARVREMIAHQRDRYNWEFMFMGVEEASVDWARTELNMTHGKTMVFGASGMSATKAFTVANNAVLRAASHANYQSPAADFTLAERAESLDTKAP